MKKERRKKMKMRRGGRGKRKEVTRAINQATSLVPFSKSSSLVSLQGSASVLLTNLTESLR